MSLVECHATGTPVGDAAEVRSTAAVLAEADDVPIGSVKSNLGHLLAPAGAAGLLKVVGALRAGVRPPSLHADDPLPALAGTPLRVLQQAEPWSGPRRAAVSLVRLRRHERAPRRRRVGRRAPAVRAPHRLDPRAPPRCRRGHRAAGGRRAGRPGGWRPRRRRPAAGCAAGRAGSAAPTSWRSTSRGCGCRRTTSPWPRRSSLLVLEAAREAVVGLDLPRERTHVVVGAGLDLTPARAGARWRAPQWLADAGLTDVGLAGQVADAFDGPAVPARAVGALPNLLANRIGTHLDLGGPGYVVAAEERSGLLALEQAARALRRGAADAVLVGAVDTACDPVHQQALRDLGSTERPGDGAVVLVLKRLDDARRDGDPVLAVLPGDADVVAPEPRGGGGPGGRLRRGAGPRRGARGARPDRGRGGRRRAACGRRARGRRPGHAAARAAVGAGDRRRRRRGRAARRGARTRCGATGRGAGLAHGERAGAPRPAAAPDAARGRRGARSTRAVVRPRPGSSTCRRAGCRACSGRPSRPSTTWWCRRGCPRRRCSSPTG
ncbi:hypothetical protein GCM10025868_30350 [Angustibacter aerolatus]|uniref:Ketosynthase family 3 (KS3) domain-containing protein n=1 Tax=Angustibacter aerolatus TaxID=1162965 RepID=A0ABQ6JKK4_9ACTN|nr:hypothetical protein GCM10025868_30350 [Angustibacter aerolatus]